MWKKVLLGILAVVLLGASGAGVFGWSKVAAFDESTSKSYDLPIPEVQLSTDPAVLERGKHLTLANGACTACHGDNYAGGMVEDLGPLGKLVYGNLTPGKNSLLEGYTDGELSRLLRHGVKRDGKTALMMPAQEWWWWPESDRVAVISFLRTLAPVDGAPKVVEITPMAKVLDQFDAIPLDIARRIDHEADASDVTPAPTAEYGALLAIGCKGCHGEEHLAGGRIPGTPPELPEPLNLTPHKSGLEGWTYADFEKLIETGTRKTGVKLHPFMPVGVLQHMNDTERRAIWAYLSALPPVEYGER